MASPTPSIDKLLKKLEKEPNSLIFLQLAEEYRKESFYEDALRTCREGLRRHPNYWSARVAMGRILYEMGDSERAREELEKVIKAVPDNLLANKILGDIYLSFGRMPEALKRYQLVQMLTPNDQEIAASIQRIEAQLSSVIRLQPAPKPAVVPPPAAPGPVAVEPEPASEAITVEEHVPAPAVEAPAMEVPSYLEKTEPGVRLADFDAMDSTMPQPTPSVQAAVAAPEPPEPVVETAAAPEMPLPGVDPVLDSDLATLFLESAHSNEVSSPAAPLEADEHFASFTQGEGQLNAADLSDEPAAPPFRQPRTEDRTQPMQDREELGEFEGDELTTQTLAELYVQQGLTDKAVRVFQKLLLNDPGNTQIVQRLRELNPADALLSAASAEHASAENRATERVAAETHAPAIRNLDQQAEDRKRKITTLENWLTAIRRERD